MPADEQLGAQFGNYLMTKRHWANDPAGIAMTNLRLYHANEWYSLPREEDEEGWKVGDLDVMGQRQMTISGRQGAFLNKVHSLYVGREHRAMTGLLLGVAHNITMGATGEGLTPSTNLSPHSHRLVRGAAERGLIPAHMVPPRPINMQDFDDAEDFTARHAEEVDVSHEELAAGRQTYRNFLRQARHIG